MNSTVEHTSGSPFPYTFTSVELVSASNNSKHLSRLLRNFFSYRFITRESERLLMINRVRTKIIIKYKYWFGQFFFDNTFILIMPNLSLTTTIAAVTWVLLFLLLVRLLCSCPNSIRYWLSTLSAHCTRRPISIHSTCSTSPVWILGPKLYTSDMTWDPWCRARSFRASPSLNNFFVLTRLARSLQCQAGDECLLEALCSDVLQNRVIRSQSANKWSNSLGSQQKERTNANSLFDPDDDDDVDDVEAERTRVRMMIKVLRLWRWWRRRL